MLQCKHFQENIFMSSGLHMVYTDKQQAIRLGLKRYVRAIACPKDGTFLRYTCDTQCVECCRLKLLNRYVNNPQKENARSKAYRVKNADEVRERNRKALKTKRLTQPDVVKGYDKTKYEKIRNDPIKLEKERKRQRDKQSSAYKKDPGKFKAKAMEYRTLSPERAQHSRDTCKKYKQNNPGVIRELNRKHNHKDRTARMMRLPKWVSQHELSEIRKLYDEARIKGLEVDHIIPLQGKLVSGLHVLSNLQLLTRSENAAKKNTYEIT